VLGEHIDDRQSTPAVVLTPGRTLDRQDSGAVAHLGAERVRVSVISESRIRPHRRPGDGGWAPCRTASVIGS
jgi:hypothetical protein